MAELPAGRVPRGTRVAHRRDANITGTVTGSDADGEFIQVEWDRGGRTEGYAADELRTAASPSNSSTGNS